MAKKISSSLDQELRRAVANFNRKITRLEKAATGENIAYPKRVSITQIKKQSSNQRELSRNIKDLKKFTKRGAESPVYLSNGAKITEYEYDIYKRDYAKAKRLIKEKREFYEKNYPEVLGKKELLTYSQSGSRAYKNIIEKEKRIISQKMKRAKKKKQAEIDRVLQKQINKGKRLEDDISLKEFRDQARKVKRQSKRRINEGFRDDFITMLDTLEYVYKLDSSKIGTIKDIIKALDIKDFDEIYRKEKTLRDLKEYYEKAKKDTKGYKLNKRGAEEVVNAVYESLEDIFGDYIDIEKYINKS